MGMVGMSPSGLPYHYIILYPPINALGISVGAKMMANKFKNQNPT
jgi:hypothetical protein